MRVLIIHNQLWAHYKSKLFSEIYRVLEEKYPGDRMEVVHIALYESSRKGMQGDDTISYRYPFRVLFPQSLDEVSLPQKLSALTEAFRQFAPDVVNITGYFDPAQLLIMAYAKLKGVKVVISTESSAADHSRTAWKEAIKRRILRQADAFFCFGKTSADYMRSLGVPGQKLVVRNAAVVDDETIARRFEEASAGTGKTQPGFIYVGRLAPEKNLQLLLRAYASALGRVPENKRWRLVLVGEGPDKAGLQETAARLGLRQVDFAGGTPWYHVPQFLAANDVLVLPSISEPWGLVVNEAMICRMPVIVSDKCGSAPDLVAPGVNGLMFDPSDETGLQEALAFFMLHPEKAAGMGRESARIVRRFRATAVAGEMVSCYKSLSQSG